MHGDYDRSGKWLIRHHGDGVLRPAGVGGAVTDQPKLDDLARWAGLCPNLEAFGARIAGQPPPSAGE
jgi:hypothetical protein